MSGESHRPLTPILLKSITIHLPFLSRYFCKSMPFSWQRIVYTPPICITIRLPFVSRYFCGSIRVRGCWNTPYECVVQHIDESFTLMSVVCCIKLPPLGNAIVVVNAALRRFCGDRYLGTFQDMGLKLKSAEIVLI